jgi:hypothetical protein
MAAGLLGRLHTGKNTYRSDSLRSQIGQSDQFQDVNALRQRHDMETLPDGAPAEADASTEPNGSDKDSASKKPGQTKPASSKAGPAA